MHICIKKIRFFLFGFYCFLVVYLPLSCGKRRKSSVVICVHWIWFTLMCVAGKLAFYHWCFLYLPSLLGTQSPFKSTAFKQSYRGWDSSLSLETEVRREAGMSLTPLSFSLGSLLLKYCPREHDIVNFSHEPLSLGSFFCFRLCAL